MTRDEQHGRRFRRGAVVLAVLLVLGGVAAVVVALTAQVHAPQPPAVAASPSAVAASPSSDSGIPGGAGATGTPAPPSAAATPGGVAPLAASEPTHVSIPAIGVSSDLLQLGQNPDGTAEVPPLAKDSKAGWYRYSPTPGELGPSVLLGHVDSAEYGAGVFFRLGALRPGDTVQVARADHSVATFSVTRVVSYPKDDFPTLQVYGNTDAPELRLITCGGAFNRSARSYVDNIVAFATLTGVSRT